VNAFPETRAGDGRALRADHGGGVGVQGEGHDVRSIGRGGGRGCLRECLCEICVTTEVNDQSQRWEMTRRCSVFPLRHTAQGTGHTPGSKLKK
jgi:hypothetical protein